MNPTTTQAVQHYAELRPRSGQLTDRYRRAVRQCWADGDDIAEQMVEQGFARDMPAYSKGYYDGVGE